MTAVLRSRGGGYVRHVPANETGSRQGPRRTNFFKLCKAESTKKAGLWGATRGRRSAGGAYA